MLAAFGLTYVATATVSYIVAALGAKSIPLPAWIWAKRSETEEQPVEDRKAA